MVTEPFLLLLLLLQPRDPGTAPCPTQDAEGSKAGSHRGGRAHAEAEQNTAPICVATKSHFQKDRWALDRWTGGGTGAMPAEPSPVCRPDSGAAVP